MKLISNFKNKFLISKFYLSSVILVFSLLVIVLGYFYLQTETQRIKDQKFDEISAISELKINQITQWLIERNSEAKFFSEDLNYVININNLLSLQTDEKANEYLNKGFTHIRNQHGYKDILIVNKNKKVIFSLVKINNHFGAETREFIDSTFKEKTVVFTDFYFSDSTKDYHLEIIAPVKNLEGEIVAAILFCFDPEKYLFPLLRSWPLPSESSEIALVRQVKDSLEYINNLRQINKKPHSLKISLNDLEIPAVQAVLGYVGIFEGIDYRGEKVIANVGTVPNTNWFFEVKIDKNEVLSELYLRYIYVSLFCLFLILFFAAGSAFAYSRRKSEIYKELLESHAEFKITLNSIGEAVIRTDNQGKIEYLNPAAEDLIGLKVKDVKGKNLDKLINLVDDEKKLVPPNNYLDNVNVNHKKSLTNDVFLISKEGKRIPVVQTTTPIKDGNGNLRGAVFVFRDLKKEREQNARIIESEKRFSALYQSIKDAILITDTNRIIVDCNEAFSEIFGYLFEEVKGKKTLSVYENEEQFYELDKAIKEHKGDKPFNYTINYKRKDGSIFPGETGIFYLKDNAGNVTGIIGLIRDITDRRRAEEKLFHQKNLMQYVIENTNSAVAVHDRDLRYLYVSKRYLKNYGIKEQNILGKHHYEIFPDLPQKWRDVHQKVLKGEILSAEEDSYLRENGSVEWTRWECRPWFESDDSIGGIIVYSEVITERVERELKLIQSEIQFRSIVEGAPDPIFIQTDMKFAYLNPAACKLFGINDSGELIGKPVIQMFHPDFREGVKARIKILNVDRKQVEIILEKLLRVDGSEVWVEVSGEPITYEEKNGALVFVRDVTQRTESEKLRTELFELLDKSLNEIYMFNSDDLKFVYVNNGAIKNLGYSLEELLNFTPIEIKPEFTKEKFLKFIEPLTKNEKNILVIESIHQRKDGSKYPVEIYLQLHKLEEKNLFLAMINDITVRKKSEKALRDSEERWKFAIEGTGDGLWDWNVQTNEVYFSKNWKTMLGYDEHEIKNDLSEWNIRVHKDDLEKVSQDIKKLLNDEIEIYINEHRVLCKDGMYKWILDRGIVMSRDDDGKPLRVIGTHKDINEEKITQIKMRQITELNQLAYHSADLGIWRHDIASGEIILDQRAQKYYDVENEKILLNELMIKIHPQDIEKLKTEMSKIFNPKSDGKTTIDYRVIHKDGKTHWLQVNTRINFEGEGVSQIPIIGFGTVADITERKEAENNLLSLKDQLASQVEAKTRELQERISELERFRDATIDRELRMKELRDEIKKLKGEET